jgi:hypothetical protein
VDAYNLYYAGRKLCGRGTPGWRWLDVRAPASSLVAEQSALWPGAVVSHVVYCTARIDGTANPSGAADQDVYLKALKWSGTVDLVEFGNYVSKVIKRPLATEDPRGRPVVVNPAWPIKVKQQDAAVPDATFMASVAVWEARRRVPVGLVNPGGGFTTGSLSGDPAVGAGLHWWRTLKARDFTSHQLADPIGRYHRPTGW